MEGMRPLKPESKPRERGWELFGAQDPRPEDLGYRKGKQSSFSGCEEERDL
jgi:hypothetical protein